MSATLAATSACRVKPWDQDEIDFLGFFVAAVQSVRPDFDGPPADPPPLPFQLQDPERLRRELAAAGLREARRLRSTWMSGG